MSYNELKPTSATSQPKRSQSSHLEWDDTKFNLLHKCLVECLPGTSGGVKKETEGDHSLCDDNNCGKMKALPSDWFTKTDECYELAEYDKINSEGKDIKITIEQDTTEIQEL
jgi:hypothetical protein